MASWSYNGSGTLSVTFASVVGHDYELDCDDPSGANDSTTATGTSTTLTATGISGMDSTENFFASVSDTTINGGFVTANGMVAAALFQFGVASPRITDVVSYEYDGANTVTIHVPTVSGGHYVAQSPTMASQVFWVGDGTVMDETVDITGEAFSSADQFLLWVQRTDDPGTAGYSDGLAGVLIYGTASSGTGTLDWPTGGGSGGSSTRDCFTTAVAVGTSWLDGITPGPDGSQVYDSILVGDKIYAAFEVDYYGDPVTPAFPHYLYRVGSMNTDGTGLTIATVRDLLFADDNSHGTDNAVHTAGGGFGTGGATGGEMRLVYDGTNVILAVLYKTITAVSTAHAGGFDSVTYVVELFREDGGAWTFLCSFIMASDHFDSFQSFKLCSSPATPGLAWLGMMGVSCTDITTPADFEFHYFFTDEFFRYEIDLATGGVTVLDATSYNSATVDGLIGGVGASSWDIVCDDGYPILVWNKHAAFSVENSDNYELRWNFDTFLTVERFDTKALICTIDYPTASAQPSETPISAAYTSLATGESLRDRRWIRVHPAFDCTETGYQERFVSVAGWDVNHGRYLFRIRSDFTTGPEQIDTTPFFDGPGMQGYTHEQFAWGIPLYDGTRNVWSMGKFESRTGSEMLQYDRRCSHMWLQAGTFAGISLDPRQDGGWDSDLYYYLLNASAGSDDFLVYKIGPVTRDCEICTPFVVVGLYAHVVF